MWAWPVVHLTRCLRTLRARLRELGLWRAIARRCLACRAQRGPLGVLPKAKRPRVALTRALRAATRGSCFAAARAACVSTWLGEPQSDLKIAGGCARRTSAARRQAKVIWEHRKCCTRRIIRCAHVMP